MWGPRFQGKCSPDAVEVEEMNPLPETAEEAVADPARQGAGPQNHGHLDQVPKLLIAGPGGRGGRERRLGSGSRAKGLMGNSSDPAEAGGWEDGRVGVKGSSWPLLCIN